MGFLFGKKETVRAMAEVLGDGRALADKELGRVKYRNEWRGKEPLIEIGVRVQPEYEPAYEATMKAGISSSFLLMPGVQVQVTYDPSKKEHVELDDKLQAIVDRNPQLTHKE